MSFVKNLISRVAVGVIAIPAIIYISLKGGFPILVFAAILAIVGAVELTRLLPSLKNTFSMIVLPIASASIIAGIVYRQYALSGLLMVSVILLAVIVYSFRGRIEELKNGIIDIVFGMIYCGLMFSFIPLISNIQPNGGEWLVSMFIIIWTADTAAFFGGKFTGRRKLAPEISPGKTVEGLLWGFVGALVAAGILGVTILDGKNLVFTLFISVVISGMGVCGDLFESSLKRSADVKDSSSLIPGHGGVLDRFDSVLFAAPTLYLLLQLQVWHGYIRF
ncbi:MAG: hypothetical protein GF307_06370 [candidate division Zixibacteria bacterium]|nr:hypothetical protein [candidate division Zixibacteria bacterium]